MRAASSINKELNITLKKHSSGVKNDRNSTVFYFLPNVWFDNCPSFNSKALKSLVWCNVGVTSVHLWFLTFFFQEPRLRSDEILLETHEKLQLGRQNSYRRIYTSKVWSPWRCLCPNCGWMIDKWNTQTVKEQKMWVCVLRITDVSQMVKTVNDPFFFVFHHHHINTHLKVKSRKAALIGAVVTSYIYSMKMENNGNIYWFYSSFLASWRISV